MHAGVIQKRGSDVAWMASFIYSINIQSGSPGCRTSQFRYSGKRIRRNYSSYWNRKNTWSKNDTKGMRSKQDMDNINAILQVSNEANKEIAEQIREEDFAMCEALRDLFKDELQEQYKAGMSQGISQGISRRDITIIHNMQKNNFTMKQMMLATGKTESEIKKILETN